MEGDIAIDISVIESLYAFLRYREHISQIAHSDHLLKFMIVQFLKCKIRRYLIMLVRYIMTDAPHIAYPILPDEGTIERFYMIRTVIMIRYMRIDALQVFHIISIEDHPIELTTLDMFDARKIVLIFFFFISYHVVLASRFHFDIRIILSSRRIALCRRAASCVFCLVSIVMKLSIPCRSLAQECSV